LAKSKIAEAIGHLFVPTRCFPQIKISITQHIVQLVDSDLGVRGARGGRRERQYQKKGLVEYWIEAGYLLLPAAAAPPAGVRLAVVSGLRTSS
jgi:hypothetical protein